MPIPTSNGGKGVVKWVIPPAAKPKNNVARPSKNGPNTTTPNSNVNDILQADNKSHDEDFISFQQEGQTQSTPIKTVIDMSVCRTICTFVDEHLRELRMHQQLINKARSRLAPNNIQNLPDLSDTTFIARNDLSKLRVRDEQTKAIETIKQLTNYLRELAYLQRICDSSNGTIDEETLSKLSDIRSDIIQALNDFVLSNHDIDVPIIDPEDFTSNGYDLCADANDSMKQDDHSYDRRVRSADESNKTSLPGKHYHVTPSSEIAEQSIEQYSSQSVILSEPKLSQNGMRQKEIQKLEKDTVALRHLFSEFYNLVKSQGEQVDLIEDNIVIATHRVSEGHQNINKSVKKLTILVSVSGCMAGALIGGPVGIVVGGKLGCITIGFATSLLGLLSSYTAQRHIGCNKTKGE